MAAITAALVKELRERTGAGMMDCKKALIECDGDMDKAIDFLREKGLAAAAKKAGRIAAEGMVDAFVNEDGIGVVVEVNEALDDQPELVNSDAYENWIIKVKLADKTELDNLMAAQAYAAFCDKQ